jgi:hypothetical protein
MRFCRHLVDCAVALAVVVCAGCGTVAGSGSLPGIEVDQSTPQATMRTLFQFQDRQLLREHEFALELRKTAVLSDDVKSSETLFGGKMKRYASTVSSPDPELPVLETYSRVIQQVVQLGGKRVLVTVAVTNTTPTPPGADIVVHGGMLQHGDGARRQLYRYTLDHGDRGWEITNVECSVTRPGEANGVTDFETVPEAESVVPEEPLIFLRIKPLF